MSQTDNTHLATRIHRQFYLDSVALMRLSRALTQEIGVHDAAMMMGTPANLEIMSNAELLDLSQRDGDEPPPGPGDLILSVRADNERNALNALVEAEKMLSQPQQAGKNRSWQPRSIASAVVEHPDANLALISVSGAFAASEARKAIRRGLNTMIFSDNVALEDELALKHEARELGVLVMGPDCGTCVINGVPLAFANKLPRGEIGIVGASGTGIQEVSCLLAARGQGLSHAIGVGGRDMTSEIGGISTLMALAALELDDATRHIVVICKPPAPEVANAVLEKIGKSTKTFTVCFIGGQAPALPANAHWVPTLAAAAEHAATAMSPDDETTNDSHIAFNAHLTSSDTYSVQASHASGERHLIRGLYCGGTLCAEAQVLCLDAQLHICSNAAIPNVSSAMNADEHSLIDLGADEYTQGKPHPMIDPAVRDALLSDALEDKRTAVVLLDVVIGYGAHDDPAGLLVNSLPENYADQGVVIVASVTGTEDDPQVRSRQLARLTEAGIVVAASNAQAAAIAIKHIQLHT